MKKCQECGTEIVNEKESGKPKKYCSNKCMSNHNSKIFRLKNKKNKTKPTYKCLACGDYIPDTTRSVKYCSYRCSKRYQVGLSGRKSFDHFYKQRQCAVCKADFYPIRVDSKCCSDECREQFKIEYDRIYSKKTTPEKRKEKHKKLIEVGTLYYRKYSDLKVEAKCPGCHRIHEVSLEEPGWTGNGMPRIKCKNWPYCARKEYEYDCDETSIPDIFESENRCYL